jgi:hypothetical protein
LKAFLECFLKRFEAAPIFLNNSLVDTFNDLVIFAGKYIQDTLEIATLTRSSLPVGNARIGHCGLRVKILQSA